MSNKTQTRRVRVGECEYTNLAYISFGDAEPDRYWTDSPILDDLDLDHSFIPAVASHTIDDDRDSFDEVLVAAGMY